MGFYYKQYPRNSIFIKGLKANKVEVYEYNIQSKSIIFNLKSFLKNFKKFKNKNFDLIILFSELPIQFMLARILAYIKRIPFVHDIYVSKLQSNIEDRNLYYRSKLLPKIIWYIILYFLDLTECVFADYLLLDTNSHIKFFHEKFNIPIKKFRRIPIGALDNIFHPIDTKIGKQNKFIVGFWGTFIPLHGIKYIIKAAKMLENYKDIKFLLIGDGQTFKKNLDLAKKLNVTNIQFLRKNYLLNNQLQKLTQIISTIDIGLGIFGSSKKTLQAIPNKIYEGIAMKIPMITSNTPAIREEFINNENIILCERRNPGSIAKSILKLKNDEELRKKISINGYTLFKNKFSINHIGKTLVNILNNIKTDFWEKRTKNL